jgi:hypothetical protein
VILKDYITLKKLVIKNNKINEIIFDIFFNKKTIKYFRKFVNKISKEKNITKKLKEF